MQEGDESQDFAFDRITDILIVLAEVTAGDFSSRVDFDLAPDHPFTALCRGVNETIDSLAKANDEMARSQRELQEKLATIEKQQVAIRELSTPVIELWDGVLCLPVVGVVDSRRASEITDSMLVAVVQRRAACAIIDVTGIDSMDTRTADHFVRMTKAVQLLGARCLLTGISPSIAQTLAQMGVDMTDVETRRTLRHALADYVRGVLNGQ